MCWGCRVGISLLNFTAVMPNFALGKGHGGVRVVPLPRDILPKVHGKWRCPQPTAIGFFVGTLHLLSSTLLPQLLNHFPIMKQKLLDFLGDRAETYFKSIEEASDGLYVYGACDMLSMSALSHLIKFARRYKLHYYVSTRRNEVYFRLYKED